MMAFVFFLIAMVAITAAGLLAYYTFHLKTQLSACRESSILLEHTNKQSGQQISQFNAEKQK